MKGFEAVFVDGDEEGDRATVEIESDRAISYRLEEGMLQEDDEAYQVTVDYK